MAELTDGYEIRKGVTADCAALPAIELAAAELFRPLNILPDMDQPDVEPLEFLEKWCTKGLLWVATYNVQVVGFVVAMDKGGDFYVTERDVHPTHGNKGLGAALMQAICHQAFAVGHPRVTLCTFRDVPWNAPFYAKLGFTEIAKANWLPWMGELAALQAAEGLDMDARCYMELVYSTS